jgi:hypothetical protein
VTCKGSEDDPVHRFFFFLNDGVVLKVDVDPSYERADG